MSLSGAVSILLALGVLATPASGSTIIPADIADLAKAAQTIFAGTVISARSEWNATKTTIVTRVAFRDVTAVKGNLDSRRVELILSGGKVGDEQIITEGLPEFVQGGRYILLCRSEDLGSERNRYLPIIGLNQGYFPVRPGHRTGGAVVLDGAGREVVAIENGKLVVAGASTSLVSEQQGNAIDLPFTVSRAEPAKQDSLRAAAARTRTAGPSRPENRAMPTTPTKPDRNGAIPAPDWVPGSQRAVLTGVPAIRVLKSSEDPGTRMSEASFLSEIRRLMTP